MHNKAKTILQCENLKKSFGATRAVDGCSLEFQEGTITSIIGPNGSGKTTLFNLISGFTPPDSGKIYYRDRDITKLCEKSKSYALAELGIAQSFQLARGFGEMTILESLMVPPSIVDDNSLTSVFKLLPPGTKEVSRWEREKKANEMLQELGLEEKSAEKLQDQDVGTQKLVELGQIFLLSPSIFLLDEPLAGVSRNKVSLLLNYIKGLKERGKTIVMIEHKMEPVLNISDIIYVLVNGKILASGSPEEIRKDERVKQAYLGVSSVRTE
jgi:ABC-type branched-subunit amino acid transport system ATPase component